jgi:hypothetical protein
MTMNIYGSNENVVEFFFFGRGGHIMTLLKDYRNADVHNCHKIAAKYGNITKIKKKKFWGKNVTVTQ